ncbi:MAG: DUF2092 domain-containing protein [Phycisphaerae bacterium]|nr:DUF2092 domain-containing protein [Phycisphaerae bacterium]
MGGRGAIRWFWCCLVIACLTPGGMAAGEGSKAAPEARGQIDGKAEDVLRQLAQCIGGAKRFAVDVEFKGEAKMGERRGARTHGTYTLAVERPKKLAVVVPESSPAESTYCDGATVYGYLPGPKLYSSVPATMPFDRVLSSAFGRTGGSFAGVKFVVGLLEGQPYEKLRDGLNHATYLGVVGDGKEKCHRLRVMHDRDEMVMWISAGEKRLLEKIEAGRPHRLRGRDLVMGGPDKARMAMTITYRNWAIDSDVPGDALRFTPPAGAKKLERSTTRSNRRRSTTASARTGS